MRLRSLRRGPIDRAPRRQSSFDVCRVLWGGVVFDVAGLDARNPDQWMLYCRKVYHQQEGMLTVLSYLR